MKTGSTIFGLVNSGLVQQTTAVRMWAFNAIKIIYTVSDPIGLWHLCEIQNATDIDIKRESA